MNLDRFGFTPTESRVYAALLRLGACTGYVVAREMGVARANVYQALEGLVRRGAARRSATIPAQYAALPPATLVAELQRGFRRDLAALEETLRALPHGADSGVTAGLEALTAAERLVERAAACVDGARTHVWAVTGPWAPPLNEAIERARLRDVTVHVRELDEDEAAVRNAWGGLPVVVVSDRGRAVAGSLVAGDLASGIVTEFGGLVPLFRRWLDRETEGG